MAKNKKDLDLADSSRVNQHIMNTNVGFYILVGVVLMADIMQV